MTFEETFTEGMAIAFMFVGILAVIVALIAVKSAKR